MLNPNYKDIGIGVVEGDLAGIDTTIIVQFFGAPLSGEPTIPVVQAKEITPSVTPFPSPSPTPVEAVTSVQTTPKVSPFTSTKISHCL